MRVLVCGGREFSDLKWLTKELDQVPLSTILGLKIHDLHKQELSFDQSLWSVFSLTVDANLVGSVYSSSCRALRLVVIFL